MPPEQNIIKLKKPPSWTPPSDHVLARKPGGQKTLRKLHRPKKDLRISSVQVDVHSPKQKKEQVPQNFEHFSTAEQEYLLRTWEFALLKGQNLSHLLSIINTHYEDVYAISKEAHIKQCKEIEIICTQFYKLLVNASDPEKRKAILLQAHNMLSQPHIAYLKSIPSIQQKKDNSIRVEDQGDLVRITIIANSPDAIISYIQSNPDYPTLKYMQASSATKPSGITKREISYRPQLLGVYSLTMEIQVYTQSEQELKDIDDSLYNKRKKLFAFICSHLKVSKPKLGITKPAHFDTHIINCMNDIKEETLSRKNLIQAIASMLKKRLFSNITLQKDSEDKLNITLKKYIGLYLQTKDIFTKA